MKKYPFKFLDSYEREDRGIFFGRDEEINALYEMVFQSSIVFIYGASGTGKTSLINCGLAGKFEPHDWLPLMVRRGGNINESLEKVLKDAGGTFPIEPHEVAASDDIEMSSSDAVVLSPITRAIGSLYQRYFRPVYLIFDQFEELYVLGNPKEQIRFIETIQDILQSGQAVKLIFSMREEYLGHLYDFERKVPQLLRKKLRVEPMNLEKVKQVLIGVANYQESSVKIKDGETDLVAEGIFEKVRGKGKSLTIQLPFLQVFLDKFYLKVSGDTSRKAEAVLTLQSLNEMGAIGDILVDFLEEQVAGVSGELKGPYPELTPQLTWKILSPFSTLEGTKEPIRKAELYERLPGTSVALIDRVVDAFMNSRMLRYNEAADTFEITHDSLAKPIADRRSVEETAVLEIKRLIHNQVAVKEEAREYFTEKQLVFIEPYLDQFKQSPEEKDWISKSRQHVEDEKELAAKRKLAEVTKRRRERLKWISLLGIVVVAGLGILAYNAFQAKRKQIDLLNDRLKVITEKDKTQELLRLVMKGRGAQYENQSDSVLSKILYKERTYPIDSLIDIRASVSPSNAGGENKNYTMWIDVPSFRRNEIAEVQYNFCRGFMDRLRVSKDPTSSFSIGYLGWGYCPIMEIDILLTSGDTIQRRFSFEDYFADNPQ